MATLGTILKTLIGFTFIRYIIAFLLGCVLGAHGMHDLVFEMIHQFESMVGIHGGIHLPSVKVNTH